MITPVKVLTKSCVALLCLSLAACAGLPEDEPGRQMLVGNWYGEMTCGSDQCEGRDLLRWTRLNTPTGEQQVHFQYSLQGKVVSNVHRRGHWGYANGVYWLTCESYVVDGKPARCPDTRYDFVVESLSSAAMTYHSEKYRVRYSARRVEKEFRLSE